MIVILVYSESGGVTKTTTAVSLAVTYARQGRRVGLVDFDPRHASTKWARLTPAKPAWHSGALLSHDDAADWIEQLLIPVPWSDNLRIIPGARPVSVLEEQPSSDDDLRLRRALRGAPDVEVWVVDMPNRQGGPLVRGALNAATHVVYASTLAPDGVSGVEGAQESVGRFVERRREIGAPDGITEAGVIAGAWLNPQIPSRIDKAGIGRLEQLGLLYPIVPHRVIVQESRATGTWYGDYDRGRPVAEAFEQLAGKVLPS